jgi:RNA polymerase sigma factor (sigma-70 family)
VYTTKDILNSIRNENDSKVLTYLYKTYFKRIRKLVTDNGGRSEDAEDIFQEAIVIFYKQVKLDKFNEAFEVGAFIYSVARNLWINEAKKNKVKEKFIDTSGQLNYEKSFLEDLLREERNLLINQVFQQLGDRCKELLIYTMYDKLSMKEICEKMGFTTEDGAKTRNYKCKQQLIGLLKGNSTIQELMKDESIQRNI